MTKKRQPSRIKGWGFISPKNKKINIVKTNESKNRAAGDQHCEQSGSRCKHVQTNENKLINLILHVKTSAYTQFKLVEMRPHVCQQQAQIRCLVQMHMITG